MGDSDPLTTDELSACFNVYSKVMASHYKKESGTGFADVRLIVALTLINKCRVEKAVQQYGDFVKKVLKPYDIDVDTSNLGLDGSEDSVLKIWRPQNLPTFFRSYRLCGKDEEGCEIFWIAGGTIQKHEEKAAVHASVLLFLAVYGDLKTLREGITFVIDVTKKDIHAGKVGNELQEVRKEVSAFRFRFRFWFRFRFHSFCKVNHQCSSPRHPSFCRLGKPSLFVRVTFLSPAHLLSNVRF